MGTLERREFLKRAGAASLLVGLGRPGKAARRRPNFIFFMTDDQRWDGMSCAGNTVFTSPHMDRLAAEGVRFGNAFVTNALCGPSRACCLTGQYSHTHGVRVNGQKGGLGTEHATFLEVLQDAGYETGFIGKWHNEGAGRARGFDYYYGFQGQGLYQNPRISENGGPDEVRQGHVTDLLADAAIRFIERPRRKPFALCLWFKAPHRSWQAAERYQHLYEGFTFPRPKTFETDYAGKPDAVRNADMKIGDFEDVPDLDTFLRRYYQCLTGVDDNLGRVLQSLDETQQAEDTCCLFTGDNGFFLGEHHFFDKRMMYEPSIRVPLLVRYPARFEPLTLADEMALHIDYAPTILDLAGTPDALPMQGRSLVPICDGEPPADWRKDWLYEYYEYPGSHSCRKNRGVRTERYKYIHWFEEPQEFELYDLAEDPNEERNLYGRPGYDELTAQLRRRLVELRRETADPDLAAEGLA